jgi:sec-independent protein translocase protein TatC
MANRLEAPEITSSEDEGEVRATLVEHLEELRARILRCVTLMAIGWVIGFFAEPYVYTALADPLLALRSEGAPIEIVFPNFATPFFLKFHLGLVIGLVLVAPFIVAQLWAFLRPGLRPNERRIVRIVSPISIVLFFGGVALAWYILPRAFQFFLSFLNDFGGAKLYQDPKAYVFFVLKMFLAFGMGFQLPILIVVLAKLDLITEESLWKYWRQAVVGMAVAAMVLTPTGDVFSMLTMLVPLSILYFGSIGVVRAVTRRARRQALAASDPPDR